MSYSRSFVLYRSLLLFWLITIVASLHAQTYNGTIRGAVTDATGAVLPNATVTLTDDATHQVRDTKTDTAGVYVFNALRPAAYSLHVAATGFGAADRTHIVLATQDFITLDIQLTVTAGQDTV